jgi:FimV-like protein
MAIRLRFVAFLWLISPLQVLAALPDDLQRVGRYSTRGSIMTPVPTDPMTTAIEVEFPPIIQTLHQALQHLLASSGYRLASTDASCPTFPSLLAWPLPAMHRRFRAERLDSVLQTLAGPAHVLVLDPVHRLVSFELRAEYRGVPWQAGMSMVPALATTPLIPMVTRHEGFGDPREHKTPRDPIKLGDELSVIADALADTFDATTEQILVGLYRGNPDSFCYHNLNCLRVGAVLDLPAPRTVTAIPSRTARRLVRQHATAWRARQRKSPTVSVTPEEVKP